EDLAQDTWVRALESERSDAPSRGWLARVVARERVHGAVRARARREREQRSARREATDSTLEVVERIATQRELARLVLDLPPAQRDVIALRFWEDLPPRRIAQRLGIGVEAVKSRQKRALAALRARLDEESGGDRGRWLTALAPLAQGAGGPLGAGLERLVARASELLARPEGAAPQLLGTALVSTAAVKLLVPAALVTAGLVYVTGRTPSDGSTVAAEGAPPRAEEPPVAPDLAAVATSAAARTAAVADAPTRSRPRGPAQPAGPAAATDTTPTVLRGQLFDLAGGPIADVTVGEVGGESDADGSTTDADGLFDLPAGPNARVGVKDEAWTTVFAAVLAPPSYGERSIAIAAPAVTLAGRVVDGWGAPIEGATVDVVLPGIDSGRLPFDLDHSVEQSWSTTTDEDGTFRLPAAPSAADALLQVRARALPPHSAAAPTSDAEDLWIVLTEPEDGDGRLGGLVVDDARMPVEGATVSYGVETTVTGKDGRFVLRLADEAGMNREAARFLGEPVVPHEIVAFAPGHRTGRHVPARDAEGAALWPESVVIELGGAPLEIEGVVLDPRGHPVSEARVWLDDATLLGMGPQGGVLLEGVQGEGGDGWTETRSGADGTFRLAGLEDRAYRLVAVDDATLLRVGPVTIQAGTSDAVLQLPEDAAWDVLRGRVVDRRGETVRDVEVRITTDTERLRVGGRVVGTRHASREDVVVTDARGTFELAVVPRRGVYLRLDGPGIVPLSWGRSEFALEEVLNDPSRVELVVGLRRRYRVELADPSRADEVGVLDGDGNPLGLSLMLGNGRRDGPRLPIEDGETGVLTVGDAAATLVLYLEGEEVQRTALQFDDGEVKVITM
ncbi:MAG: sigma-70 family RNA polymerase sigma factor, partial [Planctomycetota bacterium]